MRPMQHPGFSPRLRLEDILRADLCRFRGSAPGPGLPWLASRLSLRFHRRQVLISQAEDRVALPRYHQPLQ
jgi:hypothetical protein